MKPEGWTLRGVQPSLRPPKSFCGASAWTRSRNLPSVTPDQEAEIQEEVKREINYRFGTEEGKLGEEV